MGSATYGLNCKKCGSLVSHTENSDGSASSICDMCGFWYEKGVDGVIEELGGFGTITYTMPHGTTTACLSKVLPEEHIEKIKVCERVLFFSVWDEEAGGVRIIKDYTSPCLAEDIEAAMMENE
jgi:hypothetical protein